MIKKSTEAFQNISILKIELAFECEPQYLYQIFRKTCHHKRELRDPHQKSYRMRAWCMTWLFGILARPQMSTSHFCLLYM